MKGLFKRLSILTASLAMVFGVGLVNDEKSAKAASESTYVKVTAEPTDWSGEYILVYENSSTSAYVWTGLDTAKCYEEAKIENSKITLSPTTKLNIAPMIDGYSIKLTGENNNGKYIGGKKGDNTINFLSSEILNTLKYETTGITISSNNSTMRFNSASNNLRFRYFKTVSQQAVQLYKLDNPITLDKSYAILKNGNSLTLNATTSGDGGSVVWSSSSSDIVEVNNGVVTAKKAGNAIITATYGTGTAECKVLVNDHSGTSVDDPLTVAEAIASIDYGATNNAYVKGKVVSKDFSNTYYNYICISDDGTETNQFKFYKFYAGENNAIFDSDIISKKDTIVGYGELFKYESTYELNSGCYLVERTEEPFIIITVSGISNGTTYYVGDTINTADITVHGMYEDDTEVELEASQYTSEPALPYTLTSSDIGEKTFTISYGDLTDSFKINVKEKPTDLVLMKIKITEGENVKKTYFVGDSVDTIGLTVTAVYTSESDTTYDGYVDITDKVEWSLDTKVANAEAKLTATYKEGDAIKTASITVNVKEGHSDEYVLVTDVNDLAINDMIVIAEKDSNFAISTTQNNNNRGQSSITKKDSAMLPGNDTQRIIIKKGNKDNTFALSTEAGFLFAASSSNNYLKTEELLTDNSSWSIEITSSGIATIKAQGTNSRNLLKYNSSSNIFSCYSSGQKDVVIYKYYASSDAKNLVKTIEEADTCTDYVNINTYLDSYNNLSSEGKIFVDRSFINDVNRDGKTVEITCKTKLDFMNVMNLAKQGSSSANFNTNLTSSSSISFILVISALGLISVFGYYFIQKRKLVK